VPQRDEQISLHKLSVITVSQYPASWQLIKSTQICQGTAVYLRSTHLSVKWNGRTGSYLCFLSSSQYSFTTQQMYDCTGQCSHYGAL